MKRKKLSSASGGNQNTRTPREELESRLGAYSLVAAGITTLAVGAGPLSYAPLAEAAAKCAYQDPALTITTPVGGGTNTVLIDINGDLVNDFRFSGTCSSDSKSIVIRGLNDNFVSLTSHNYYLAKLSYDTPIESASHDHGEIFRVYYTYSWGQWGPPPQEGYIGVKFKIGSSYHKGWILYKQEIDASENLVGTIKAWGYNDEADSDLTAGQNCTGPTLVDLISFTAAPHVADSIGLAWETASEIDNAGFHVWRSENRDWGYQRITQVLIPAEGSPTQGAAYAFVDNTATPGKTWFYKLEDIDAGGNATLHGPKSAWAGEVNIEANGSDGPVVVAAGAELSVTATIQAHEHAGTPVECWVAAYTPFGWWSYGPGGWTPGIERAAVMPLADVPAVKVLQMPLPAGAYTFYLAVDDQVNDTPEPTFLDSVEVQVE